MIVLLPYCGFLSETSRMLHIGQALRRLGQAVHFACHGGPYADLLRQAGEKPTILEPRLDEARNARFIDDLVNIGKPGVRMMDRAELELAVDQELSLFTHLGAKAVITGFQLSAYLSARAAGVPLITSHGGAFVGPLFDYGLAPVPTTMPIPGTQWLPAWAKKKLANAGPVRMKHPCVFLNELADRMGIEQVPSLAAMMMGDLTLLTETPEVLGLSEKQISAWTPRRAAAYRRDPKVVLTGPLFARLDTDIPKDVVPFLDGSAPTVYVVLSSTTTPMLRDVVARVAAAGTRVIVGSTIHSIGDLRNDRLVVAPILPSHRIMPKVDLVVGMGGQGTVQCAMASGTPLLGIPMHPEQELNVALVAKQKAGVAVAPRHATQARMTELVKSMLATPSFKAGALAVQQTYQLWDGAERAALAIAHYLTTQPQGGITPKRREPGTMSFGLSP
jgi:UDP:flavonoid glycosyltransferase YjiC (YdhE family)